MDELQALQHQLEEARDEAELNLLQLQHVQEELEFYFLRCQELEAAQNTQPEADPGPLEPPADLQALQQDADIAIRLEIRRSLKPTSFASSVTQCSERLSITPPCSTQPSGCLKVRLATWRM